MTAPAASAAAVLCVTGLAAEARIARRAGFPVVVGAGDRRHTAARVAAAMADAQCLVSFGIAGALSDALRPGDLVLSAEVVSGDGCWRADDAWYRRLADLAAVLGAAAAPVFGSGEILATPADKARARSRFSAVAVDLESAIVARAAAAAGIPFAVLRAIADPANRTLPPAAIIPLGVGGKPDLGRILRSLRHRPRQAAALLGLLFETRRALAALSRAAPELHRLVARE
jgi:adenosylhomocysteine nucleosidase